MNEMFKFAWSPWRKKTITMLMMTEDGGSSRPVANEFVYTLGDALEAKGWKI